MGIIVLVFFNFISSLYSGTESFGEKDLVEK